MGAFHQRISQAPGVHDSEKAERLLLELGDSARASDDLGELKRLLETAGPVRDLVACIFGASSYLSGLILRDPGALQDWLMSDPDECLDQLNAEIQDELAHETAQDEAMRRLRRYKGRLALWLALADIGGVWDVETVTRKLSEGADTAVAAAVRYLFARAANAGKVVADDPSQPEASSGYFILGLGKLGAWELNYSSDIDLIVFYDRERAQLAEGTEPASFFVRFTRDLVHLLQERTSDGYVFRTDLRLRPDPGATQVALSTEAGLTYYESFGQNWERAALIKARVIAGDQQAGSEFLEQLAPFIWRKYLDYAAMADIHAMKRRVHNFKGHGEIAVAGHDIKLGRGGIREIEFFVQTHQLIAGGRQTDLRGRGTLAILGKLVDRNWVDAETAAELSSAYRFLRHVEHRLQMIADEQTHTLPKQGESLERIARFSGFGGASEFADALVERLTCVQTHFDGLFDTLPESASGQEGTSFRGDDDDPESIAVLSELGYRDIQTVLATIRAWRSGRYAATRSERARQRLNEFIPDLLKALASTADPDAAFASFDRFLAELPAGVQLFSLLGANPNLLRLIGDIMGTAPRLARVLGRRARVLDAVLDPGFFGTLPTPDELSNLVESEINAAVDYQDCLDTARAVGTEQAFLIGVRVLSGTISAQQAGVAYALLAEKLIASLLAAVTGELERAHGGVNGGQAAVIAMGKLGGREMTAASDLDLITVYDFDPDTTMSDGSKPLAGGQYYARLTQRLISALTAPTAEGALYEVDMRLRPSGNAGPVATRLEGFVDYQENEAWTWEHMALTRARIIAGPEPLTSAIEQAIANVLCKKRDRKRIAGDVLSMRAKIEAEKRTSDIWELKQVRGGLVDLEFIVQFLQVINANDHPDIIDPNTCACLEKLAEKKLISAEDAGLLIPAARLYHDLTQLLRLCLDKPFDRGSASSGLKVLLAQAVEMPDFDALERHLTETLGSVHAAFGRLIV